MPDTSDTLKKKTLNALKDSMGIVTTACEKAGIHRSTFYDWKALDEDFAKEVAAIDERTGDFVEGALLKKIKDGDTTGILFYCKTKLKNRGYVERKEHAGVENQPIQIKVENEKTKEALEKLANVQAD